MLHSRKSHLDSGSSYKYRSRSEKQEKPLEYEAGAPASGLGQPLPSGFSRPPFPLLEERVQFFFLTEFSQHLLTTRH